MPQAQMTVWPTSQCPNDQKISNTIEKDQYITTQELGRLAAKSSQNVAFFQFMF